MGSLPPELTLDLRPTFVPKTITEFLYQVSTITNAAHKLSMFDDFLLRLEDEMRKIDAFKRELPLCMLLLNDAILSLKEESSKLRTHVSKPVLEEFIPLKKECDNKKDDDEKEKECRDKKNWMSSVQLWNTDNNPPATNNAYDQRKHHYELETKKCEEEGQSVPEDPFQSCRNSDNGCRGFLPFNTYSSTPIMPVIAKEEKEDSINGLSLLTPGAKVLREGSGSSGSRSSSSRAVSSSTHNLQPIIPTGHQQPQKQGARKQRRCWSPELHRRFVNALQQLGGSLAATPKQIRELMQVDGLTNDEVKSHLQKYRLHSRRTPASTASAANQSAVVGGMWMSQDQHNVSSKASSSASGSPQGPLQLAASGGGMEDDEDEKSECRSWKSHIQKSGKDV